MEKKLVLRYFVVCLIFVALTVGLVFLRHSSLTGLVVFEDTGNEFEEGSFNNTEYFSDAIRLVSGATSGDYISKIFDAGNNAKWNFLSWEGSIEENSIFYLVSAVHRNVNRSEVFELDSDYYLADMRSSERNFYLNFSANLRNNTILKLFARRINGKILGIYPVDRDEVFGTLNIDSSGGEWYSVVLNIQNSTNAIVLGEGRGSENNPKAKFDYIYAEILGNNLSFQVRNCSLADCSDASFFSADLTNLSLQGKYFQYKAYFETSMNSPNLNSVSLNYDLINSAPLVDIISPEERTYNYTNLSLNFSVSDADNNIDSCWYHVNSLANISIANCQNTSFNFSNGIYSVYLYVNDSLGLFSSDYVGFVVNYSQQQEENETEANETGPGEIPSSTGGSGGGGGGGGGNRAVETPENVLIEAEKEIISINEFEMDLLSSSQESDKLNFVYFLKEDSGIKQEVNIKFYLENNDGGVVSEEGKDISLNEGEELRKEQIFDVSKITGLYVLKIEAESEGSEIRISEPVLIRAGFVKRIIELSRSRVFLFTLIFGLIIFIVVQIINKIIKKPLEEDKTGYVRVKLKKGE